MTIIYSDKVIEDLKGCYISPFYFKADKLEKCKKVYTDSKEILEAYKNIGVEVLPITEKKLKSKKEEISE